jgi:hypothetical protein
MAYRQLEELRERKGEKVIAFLTMENAIGAGAGAILMLIVAGSFSPFIKYPLIVVSALIGIILTIDHGGVALYNRLLWFIRGQLRVRLKGEILSPESLAGTSTVSHRNRALRVGGPVKIVSRQDRVRIRMRR